MGFREAWLDGLLARGKGMVRQRLLGAPDGYEAFTKRKNNLGKHGVDGEERESDAEFLTL